LQDQAGKHHTRQHPTRKQVWLLPISLLLALPLAWLILKPKQADTPDAVNASQAPAGSAATKIEKSHGSELTNAEAPAAAPTAQPPRFIKLSAAGTETHDDSFWPCVFDQQQQLIWEVKSADGSWQDKEFTFSWYASQTENSLQTNEPADPGAADGGNCIYINCDTAGYLEQMNTEQICARNNWRLPTEQELRSLDHPTNFYPDIDTDFFPHTMSGYYWSSTESTKNRHLAIAVDFNNNIGYATEKRVACYVRAVANPVLLTTH
jgi:hypothetical protein